MMMVMAGIAKPVTVAALVSNVLDSGSNDKELRRDRDRHVSGARG
jgi:hypothetical protein